MTTISVSLDHRATHRIEMNGAIQLNYKNYWISVSDDTTNVRVYEKKDENFGKFHSNEDGNANF